jgi:intracellular multiplication protein IcmT
MKSARFFALDARAAFPFLLVLIHFKTWTIALAFITTFIFWLAERLGLRFDAALRAVRAWFVVPRRPAQAFQLNRRMVDLSGTDISPESPIKIATPKNPA